MCLSLKYQLNNGGNIIKYHRIYKKKYAILSANAVKKYQQNLEVILKEFIENV